MLIMPSARDDDRLRAPEVNRRTGRGVLLRLGRAVAKRQALSVMLIGVLAFVGAAAVTWTNGVPLASIHDEFSYLLAADTFARARITNPPHVLWEHFETFHVLVQPTYMSKYPPMQGLFLGIGQAAYGHPVAGLWLSAAFLCAAMTWMFQAWLPPRWALLAGLLSVFHFGAANYWSQSYWGGAIAAGAGALVLGSFRRLLERPRTRDAIVLGLGLLMLANSRPWEGFLLSLPLALVMLVWLARQRGHALRGALLRVVLPTVIVLGLGLAAMAAYNKAGTGSYTTLPYSLYQQQYMFVPYMHLKKPSPKPEYRHKPIEQFMEEHELPPYLAQRSPRGMFNAIIHKSHVLRGYFIDWPMLLPFLLSLCLLRQRWMVLAWTVLLSVCTTLALTVWLFPHYVAPATALFMLLNVSGLRLLALLRLRERRTGLAIVTLLCLGLVAFSWSRKTFWMHHLEWAARRDALRQRLAGEGRPDLVIVRYTSAHNADYEWVFNEADIDSQAVIWARDMGDATNQRLLDYFPDRSVWLLTVGAPAAEPTLEPYSGSQSKQEADE